MDIACNDWYIWVVTKEFVELVDKFVIQKKIEVNQ